MSKAGFLSEEEHTWLETIYNCWTTGECRQKIDKIDRIETLATEINQTTREMNATLNQVWDQFVQTDKSVVLQEDIISSVVNSTSNLTINYSLYVPIKQDYQFLPIRIFYWFLDETNTTCYNQESGMNDAEAPLCKPLIAQTIGKVNTTISFHVDLRPHLPAGNYTIVRRIDIDPEQIWINYGHESVGHVDVQKTSTQQIVRLSMFDTAVESAATTASRNTFTGQVVSQTVSNSQMITLLAAIIITGMAGILLFAITKKWAIGSFI